MFVLVLSSTLLYLAWWWYITEGDIKPISFFKRSLIQHLLFHMLPNISEKIGRQANIRQKVKKSIKIILSRACTYKRCHKQEKLMIDLDERACLTLRRCKYCLAGHLLPWVPRSGSKQVIIAMMRIVMGMMTLHGSDYESHVFCLTLFILFPPSPSLAFNDLIVDWT